MDSTTSGGKHHEVGTWKQSYIVEYMSSLIYPVLMSSNDVGIPKEELQQGEILSCWSSAMAN